VRVTVARVWDVDGECLDGRGVVPHVRVAAPADGEGAGGERATDALEDDPFVRAAVEALAAQGGGRGG
jgi:hypothetical protein